MMNHGTLWTVDQALLWLGTADTSVVEGAGPWVPEASRWTWVSYQLAVACDDVEPFEYGREFAESTLLTMLMKGEVAAFVDQRPVAAAWFFKAALRQIGEEDADLLGSPEMSMCFHRPRDILFQSVDRRFTSRDVDGIAPLIEAVPLLSVHGGQRPSSAPTEPIASPLSAQARRPGSKERAIIEMIRREFPGGLSASISNLDVQKTIDPHLGEGLRSVTDRTMQRAIKAARVQ